MLQEIEIQTITLTPAASKAVQEIISQRELTGYALRVYVAGGGCCGVNFGIALDNTSQETDRYFESDGVKVVVDNISLDYLQGATIDFVNDPNHGPGFAVNSPHVQEHEHAHGDGGCACGGSCDCNN